MNALISDPHTPLVEALAMADGLSALAAQASEEACRLKGFELMMLLMPIRDRIETALRQMDPPAHPPDQ